MSTAAIAIQNMHSTEWDERFFDALGAVSSVASVAKKKASVLSLSYKFYKANRSLDALFNNAYGILEGRIPLDPDAKTFSVPELRTLADNVLHLGRILEYTYESMRRVGMTNNSHISLQLAKMRSFVDPLNDLADWIETAAQSKEVNEIFSRSTQEVERGEVFALRIE